MRIIVLLLLPLVVAAAGVTAYGIRVDVRTPGFSRRTDRRSVSRQITVEEQQAVQNQPNLETFVDLVKATGYHVEEHVVTTDDGYILTIHRMPGSSKSPIGPNKPAVLITHGMLAASDVWVLRGPDKDLAYIMVDAGYDVWLLNTRGNFYSRRHKKLQPKEEKFWRFSWHESGEYDMATAIDHVLKTTGRQRVSLVGHSMGTTCALVLLSFRPEYNAKVNAVISYAPVAIFTHLLPGPGSNFAVRYGKQLQKTFRSLGIHEVFPRNPNLMIGIYSALCQTPHIELLCQKLTLNVAGLLKQSQFDPIDVDMMPKILNHYPQGSSLLALEHYRQIMISGKFRQYDFGPHGNHLRYKNVTPPEYPLERITVPVFLYYGVNDAYTTKEDVLAIKARLPNAEAREVTHSRFSHLDFLFSNYTREVYDDTVLTLDRYREDRQPTLQQAIQFAKHAPTTVTV